MLELKNLHLVGKTFASALQWHKVYLNQSSNEKVMSEGYLMETDGFRILCDRDGRKQRFVNVD